MYTSVQKSLIATSFLLLLTACGGGTSGDSGTSPGIDKDYTGKKEEAKVTESNARDFLSESSSDPTKHISLRSDGNVSDNVNENNAPEYCITKNIREYFATRGVQQRPVNDSETCQFGGSVAYKGDIDEETNLGNLTISYSQCKQSQDAKMNGSATVSVNKYDSNFDEPSSMKWQYNNLNVQIVNNNFQISGNASIEIDFNKRALKYVLNSLQKNQTNGVQLLLQDYHKDLTFTDMNTLGLESVVFSGRAYHSKYGYVTVSTPKPFLYSGSSPYSGEMIFTGANKSKSQIIPTGSGYTINTDEDGDGIYEKSSTVYWSDL